MTIRQLLKALRAQNPDRVYKSRRLDGQTIIVSKPDFARVPYDSLKDYWALDGRADYVVEERGGHLRFR